MPRLNRIIETALYVDDLDRARGSMAERWNCTRCWRRRPCAPMRWAASVLLIFLRGASLHTQRPRRRGSARDPAA